MRILTISAVIVLVAIYLFMLIGGALYSSFGIFRIFFHDVLGWHKPSNGIESFDGVSLHATCKYCGKDIMQDSQGNWF